MVVEEAEAVEQHERENRMTYSGPPTYSDPKGRVAHNLGGT